MVFWYCKWHFKGYFGSIVYNRAIVYKRQRTERLFTAALVVSLWLQSVISKSAPSDHEIGKGTSNLQRWWKVRPSNYRPISILSTVSKIFEKHVNKHLMAYLNKYKILHDNQSGFRPKHSCQTVLINDWMKCIDDLVGALFIDFRKAFDLVDHSILLNKLALYKLNPSAIQWLKSYLCSRQQVIESDKKGWRISPPYNLVCLRVQYWARPYFSFLSTIFRFISKSAPLICMQMTRRFTRMVMT